MKKYLFLIMLVILSSLALGASFTLDYDVINDTVKIGEQAKYDLTILNKLSINDSYRLSFDNTKWVLMTTPVYARVSSIDSGAKDDVSVKLMFTPKDSVKIGPHLLPIEIVSEGTDDFLTLSIPIYVHDGFIHKEYSTDIKTTWNIDSEIDPRDDLRFTLTVENRNKKNITSMTIYVDSGLISKNVEISLGPLERKVIEFRKDLDDKLPPRSDTLTGRLEAGSEIIDLPAKTFAVVDYTGAFKKELASDGGILKTVDKYTFTNDGNSYNEQEILLSTNFFMNLFTKTNPSYQFTVDKEGVNNYGWNVALSPGENYLVTKTTNYRLLIYLVLFLVLVYLFYFMNKSPLMIKKSTKNIEINEGGISEVKVSLIIKNDGNKSVEGIEILDKIPNIADISRDFQIGTMAPSSILKHKSGAKIVKYLINELEPLEERIITYRMKSKLSILGNFVLPPAVVKWKTKSGKSKSIRSNRLSITS